MSGEVKLKVQMDNILDSTLKILNPTNKHVREILPSRLLEVLLKVFCIGELFAVCELATALAQLKQCLVKILGYSKRASTQ